MKVFFINVYLKVMIFIYEIKYARQKAKIEKLKSENEKIRISLGKHDFPTSIKSTKYPDS